LIDGKKNRIQTKRTKLEDVLRKRAKEAKRIREPIMMQTGFANATHITNAIRKEMQSSNTELLYLFQT